MASTSIASMGSARGSADGGAGGEDIRSKLARYKKEREDFELVRQQFRKKNSELTLTNSVATKTNIGDSIPNVKGAGNIFDMERSATQVQSFTMNMMAGSPAFGHQSADSASHY